MDDFLPMTSKHAGRAHSIWGASKAERWFPCPGSLRMEREAGEGRPSHYAIEGSAMHALAERCLRTGRPAITGLGDEFLGVAMEEEHVEAVQTYLDTIHDDWLQDGGDLLVEHSFNLDDLWDGLFGTNDACLISTHMLRVYDFKGGKGKPVEVEGNKQLLIYGTGALRSLERYDIRRVELVIVQPRCPHRHGPVRRWQMDVVELWEWQDELRAALARTMDPDAPLQAGDHCVFCPAKPRCPALRDLSLQQARMDFGGIPPMPNLLSTEELIALLPKVELMDEFIAAVKAHALALAEGGVHLPGWKLVPKRALRKWKDVEGAKQFLLEHGMTPTEIYEPPELRSPAQMEKVLPKNRRWWVKVAAEDAPPSLVHAVSSGHNLVPEIDMRPADRPAIETDFKRLDD